MAKQTYGDVADTAPEGFLARRVHFSTLVSLDTPTEEGMLRRTIMSDGFGSRPLPLPIDGLGWGRGHMETVPVGRLDKIVVDGTNAEGWGWIRDDEAGQTAYRDLALKVQNGNSIVMADVKAKVSLDDEGDDVFLNLTFTQANIARTTLVMSPAFPNARADLEQEIAASLAIEGDLEVAAGFSVVWPEPEPEVTAGTRRDLPHDAFTVAEPDIYTTFQLSRDGTRVFGHLGRWNEPHTGFLDRYVMIPRSSTNYAHYCKTPQYTERGKVHTGPLILLGGHKATAAQINEALADVKNAWADVVVVDGKIGPWVCGVVRPGVTDAALAAGAGSRISGHWLRGELYAICSVSAEGFDVPRATEWIVETDADGEVEYLAASFAVGAAAEGEETFSAFGSHKTATVKGTWDAGAQEKNVTSPNTLAYYGRIYAWQKPGATATNGKYAKTDMGFPHHMVGADGTPGAANLTGCSAGIGRCNQGNGGADRQGIYNHLASHLRDGGQEPPKLMSMEEIEHARLGSVMSKIEEIMEDGDGDDASAGE